MQFCQFFCILMFTQGNMRQEDQLLEMPDLLEVFFMFQFELASCHFL